MSLAGELDRDSSNLESIDGVDNAVKHALERSRRKLLDLSRRNRLLNFRETSKTLRIVEELPDAIFDVLVNQESSMEFIAATDALLARYSPLSITPENDALGAPETLRIDYQLPIASEERVIGTDNYLQTPLAPEKLEARLKRLYGEHQSIIDETGNSTLYMAIGFLEWFESDDSTVANLAPLILIPVHIEKARPERGKSASFRYKVSYDGQELQSNVSLAERLKRDFDLVLPNISAEDEEIAPEEYFRSVAESVEPQKRWRIRREIVIDFFSFSKIFMYLDLDTSRWPADAGLLQHHLIRQLFNVEPSSSDGFQVDVEDLDSDQNISRIPLVLDADSSQHKVIAKALGGKSMVVEGPPGTGKSQTITNLIASLLHAGKTVLFVAEKLAALQVVKSRLDSVELGAFVLELHSHKVKKQEVLTNLKQRLEFKPNQTERFNETLLHLESCRSQLNSYVKLVNSYFKDSGFKVFEVLWAYDDLIQKCGNSSFSDGLTNRQISKANVIHTEADLLELQQLLQTHSRSLQIWKGFDLQNLNPANFDEFKQIVAEYRSTIVALGEATESHSEISNMAAELPLDGLKITAKRILNSECTPPEVLSQLVASACANKDNAERLESYANKEAEIQQLGDQVKQVLPPLHMESAESFDALHISLKELVVNGFGSKCVDDLEELAEASHNLSAAIDDFLSEAAPSLAHLGIREPRAFEDVAKIHQLLVLTSRSLSPDFVECVSELTLDSSLEQFCSELEAASLTLTKSVSGFHELILTDMSSTIEEVKQALSVVRSRRGSWLNFLSSDLRKVRRKAREWLKHPRVDLGELEIQLGTLSECLSKLSEFTERKDCRARFGAQFRGVRSNWEEIKRFQLWTVQVLRLIPSNEVLRRIQNSFPDFQKSASTLVGIFDRFLNVFVKEEAAIKKMVAELPLRKPLAFDYASKSSLNTVSENSNCIHNFLKQRLPTLNVKLSSSREALDSYSQCFQLEQRRRQLCLETLVDKEWIDNVICGCDAAQIVAEEATIAWCISIHQLLPPRQAAWMLTEDSDTRHDELSSFLSKISLKLEKLETLVTEFERFGESTSPSYLRFYAGSNTIAGAQQYINGLQDSIELALSWSDVCRSLASLRRAELPELAASIEEGKIPFTKIRDVYLLSVYKSLANAIFQQHPELGSFSRQKHEALRTRFKELDKKIKDLYALAIAEKLAGRRVPRGFSHSRAAQLTDLSLIQHEIQKKKRHIPIRQLVTRAGRALQAMKPCFMMSPLSVAQFIPPNGLKFDVVVMDEASQLRPEDCLGAVARGGQIIVVGDPKQLPPTQFFDRFCDNDDDREEETSIDDMESILDMCVNVYSPAQRLIWHYRSEHEDLIRFSNYHFYDQSLMLFPSPRPKDDRYGVHHRFVDGAVFAGRRNKKEAEEIARAVLTHLEERPDETLGVGTFNREQRDLVEEEIELLLRERPHVRPLYDSAKSGQEKLFVKNLENIQGDERDVIFISCTYGPDKETGKVHQRFGPINTETGWRRLNVIFTRAKKRLVVFASMKSDDIHADETKPRGVRMLKQYLKFAEDKMMVDLGETTGRGADSCFEVSVGEVVRQLGYEFEPNLGVAGFFIDIAVRHPKRRDIFMIGIECDGASYHSARSARDRDRLREEILERKGWRLHRIWSTDWFKNRKSEVDRLANSLKAISNSIDVSS